MEWDDVVTDGDEMERVLSRCGDLGDERGEGTEGEEEDRGEGDPPLIWALAKGREGTLTETRREEEGERGGVPKGEGGAEEGGEVLGEIGAERGRGGEGWEGVVPSRSCDSSELSEEEEERGCLVVISGEAWVFIKKKYNIYVYSFTTYFN